MKTALRSITKHGEAISLKIPTMKPLNGVKEEIGVNKAESEAPKIEPEKIDFSKVEIEPLFKDFVDFETFSKSDFRAVKVLACEAVPKSKKLLKFTLDDGSGENRTILSGIHAYYEPEELVGKTCTGAESVPASAGDAGPDRPAFGKYPDDERGGRRLKNAASGDRRCEK